MTKSIINIKTTEVSERALNINHIVGSGKSLIISLRDELGDTKTILDITAGDTYQLELKAIITDKEVIA